jgi:hypothetical protein
MREAWTHATNSDKPDGKLTDVQRDHGARDRLTLSLIRFLNSSLESLASYLQRVRPFVEKTSNTSVRSMLRERFLFSVLTMLTAFAIFWMSCISAILSGSIAILLFLLTTAGRFGRRMQRFARSITLRLNV